MLYPKIYYVGQQNTIFNYTHFFTWVLEAILEALLIVLIVIYVLGVPSIDQYGYNSDLWMCSLTT
jgi:magnesium-transporting ATPase (P-type)